MGIFDDVKGFGDLEEQTFLRSDDFKRGLVFLLLDKPQIVECNNPKWGIEINGKQGMTIKYLFTFPYNTDKKIQFDSHSKPFKKAMERANVKIGDRLKITKYGAGFDTHYEVEVLEQKGDEEEDMKEVEKKMKKDGGIDMT